MFVGTGETTHNYGPAVETNTEECEVLGEQLEIPAQPAVTDPCDPGNAEWVVPADTDELDWTLQDDGVLTVDITVPDTVFEGTEETSWSFGRAEETNTEACEVKGEEQDDDEPAPAVQPKQWRPMAMRRPARPCTVASKMVCGAPAPAGRSIIWLKSQS